MSTVSLFPGPGEPQARSWTAVAAASVVARILSSAPADGRRRSLVVGIDGRSGSGKTRLAELLSGELVDAQIVHTDDVAWYESMFGWDHLLAQHVLRPLRNGVDVCYRPPAWDRRNRPGAIVAAVTRRFTIVEGCGSIRQSLSPLLDYRIWVQADQTEAERRGIQRDGGTAAAADFWREWQAQELPFFAVDRPWERADLLVCGTPPRDLAVGLVLVSVPDVVGLVDAGSAVDDADVVELQVSRATEAERPVLGRLLELYRYDFSEFDNRDLNPDGEYGYGYLHDYWTDSERHPFLLRVGGQLAGFALVRTGARTDMAEFFVLRKYRRRGVGRAAADEIFRMFPGRWSVRQQRVNPAATAFWRSAIRYPFAERTTGEEVMQEFTVS